VSEDISIIDTEARRVVGTVAAGKGRLGMVVSRQSGTNGLTWLGRSIQHGPQFD
jgi:hypothetical protein